MKVKIKNEVFDNNVEPIMLTLSSEEFVSLNYLNKATITAESMDFCFFPKDCTPEDISNFMTEEVKNQEWFDVPSIIIHWVLPGLLVLILLTILFH